MRIWAVMFGLALAFPAGVLYLIDNSAVAAVAEDPRQDVPTVLRFEIDAARSKLMVKARRGGLAWFKGHDHHIAVRDLSGHVEFTPDSLDHASLEMAVRAASLEETSDVFTPQQKAIINKELKEIVLETEKYPEITFRSTNVTGALKDGSFEMKIAGDIMLHGVTRRITIPATVSVQDGTLHAVGKFTLDRSEFNVKATSAFHGLVRIKDRLKFTFDIVGRPQ
jgi:polyisoprenoid-binding protein YceI